jgi:hypothetical protein
MRTTAVAISLILLLAACAKKHVLPPPEPPVPYQGAWSVDALRQRVAFASISSLRSEVSVTMTRGEETLGRLKGAFLHRSPDAIRLRLFDPFGNTAMDLVGAYGQMQILVPSRGQLFEGPAPFLGPPRDALWTLKRGGPQTVLYALRPEDDVQLRLVAAYHFDAVTALNTAIVAYQDGQPFVASEFDGFSAGVPRLITLSFPGGFSMRMTLLEPETDVDLGPDVFKPLSRQGREVQSLQRLLLAPSQ